MNIRKTRQVAACLLAFAVLGGCTETRDIKPNLASIEPTPVTENVPSPTEKPEVRPADAWTTNEEALKIIEEAEGLRLRAYRLAGQWLIGYGHATDDQSDAAQDLAITEHEAERLLKEDIAECEEAVGRAVNVKISQNQFSALVAFCYNIGQTAFSNSRIVRHLNGGQQASAADAFLLYDHARMEEEKVKVARLTERRIRERYLFLAS